MALTTPQIVTQVCCSARAAGSVVSPPMLSVLLHKARQPPELASGPGEFDGARRDTAAPGTEELAREAVEAGIRRYCATRRERIPEFVDRNFSLRAAVPVCIVPPSAGTCSARRSTSPWRRRPRRCTRPRLAREGSARNA